MPVNAAETDLSLTWPVVLIVIGGAMLHAGWNALIKAGDDKALDTALIHVLASVAVVPLLVLIGPPPLAALPFLFTSLVIHVGYYFALARAYEHGELGLTYPLIVVASDVTR